MNDIEPYNHKDVALTIGAEISKSRRLQKLKQAEFASLLGMSAAQVCKIEKGRNIPTDETLSRIENCLKLRNGSLIRLRGQLLGTVVDYFIPTHNFVYDYRKSVYVTPNFDSGSILSQNTEILQTYLELEDRLNLPHFCKLDFSDIPLNKSADAETLADALRHTFDCGQATFDALLLPLEQENVRIVFIDELPPSEDHFGKSYRKYAYVLHDKRYDFPIINLAKNDPPDRQLYAIANELGRYLLFRKHGTLYIESFQEKFARAFALSITMPAPAVYAITETLRIAPDQWTIPLLHTVAHAFKVPTPAVIRRLAQLKRIERKLLRKLTPEIKQHKNTIPFAKLPQDTWLTLLTERAKIG